MKMTDLWRKYDNQNPPQKIYAAMECESVETSGLLQVRFELWSCENYGPRNVPWCPGRHWLMPECSIYCWIEVVGRAKIDQWHKTIRSNCLCTFCSFNKCNYFSIVFLHTPTNNFEKKLHFKTLVILNGYLKALNTFVNYVNCQRPVLSLGASQHMHKITNLWNLLTQLVIKVARE